MESNKIQLKRINSNSPAPTATPSTIDDGEIVIRRVLNSTSSPVNTIFIGTGNNRSFTIDSQPKTLYTTGGSPQSVIVALQAGVSGTGSLQYKKMTNGVVDSQWTTVSANVSTTADSAKKLVTSGGANYSAGGTAKPVYFSGGVPTPCGFNAVPEGHAITMKNGTIDEATKFNGTINTEKQCIFNQIDCKYLDVENDLTTGTLDVENDLTTGTLDVKNTANFQKGITVGSTGVSVVSKITVDTDQTIESGGSATIASYLTSGGPGVYAVTYSVDVAEDMKYCAVLNFDNNSTTYLRSATNIVKISGVTHYFYLELNGAKVYIKNSNNATYKGKLYAFRKIG